MGAIVRQGKGFAARLADFGAVGDRPPTGLYDLPSEALYAEAGDAPAISDLSGSRSVCFTVLNAVCLRPTSVGYV